MAYTPSKSIMLDFFATETTCWRTFLCSVDDTVVCVSLPDLFNNSCSDGGVRWPSCRWSRQHLAPLGTNTCVSTKHEYLAFALNVVNLPLRLHTQQVECDLLVPGNGRRTVGLRTETGTGFVCLGPLFVFFFNVISFVNDSLQVTHITSQSSTCSINIIFFKYFMSGLWPSVSSVLLCAGLSLFRQTLQLKYLIPTTKTLKWRYVVHLSSGLMIKIIEFKWAI